MLHSPGTPECKKLRTADHMCGYLGRQESQVSSGYCEFLFITRYLPTLYVPTCSQEAEKARQYARELKQMKAERDKAEKVLMQQLELCGEEDEEESERSRQLLRNFQLKVNKSVKGKKKTKSQPRKQPKKTTKKTTTKKNTPTNKDLPDDEGSDTESEVDWDEEAEGDEEVEPEVDSDNDKEAESDAAEIMKIKSHRFVKGVCWIKMKFKDEDDDIESEVWWLWYEFKNELREYIKRKKLKGKTWQEPIANRATKIVAVFGHREKNREKQLRILWNNGYHEWATEKSVVADKQSFVEEDLLDVYWQKQKKEAVKKSKKQKSTKK